MATVVVGLDGSDGSLRALRFAAEEARLRGAKLRAVLAWEYPLTLYEGAAWAMADAETMAEFERVARERLDRTLTSEQAALEGVEVEREVVQGGPAPSLIDAAADADLLVVGTRGHGGFVGLLLGSVSQHCVHHAPCPVVVVPGER